MIYSASTGFPHLVSHEHQMHIETKSRDELAEWDSLLTALTARLRSAVGASQRMPASKTSTHQIQKVVLECATDLDLLHIALSAEKAKRHQLELRFNSSNAAVVRAIAGVGESLHPATPTKDKPRWGKRASAFYRIFG